MFIPSTKKYPVQFSLMVVGVTWAKLDVARSLQRQRRFGAPFETRSIIQVPVSQELFRLEPNIKFILPKKRD